jgi:hypothetical protein
VDPVDDDRPFFFHTLKSGSLPVLEDELGGGQIPLGDWGTLLLVWGVVQSVALALVLLVLPLLVLGARGARIPYRAHAFFALLGLGYLTIEISLLGRLSLFLAEPIYAATLVISTLLLGSGLGSWTASRCRDASPATRIALGTVVALSVGYALFLPRALEPLRGASELVRGMTAALSLLPLAFAMGFPFPLGLRALHARHPDDVPWAWGVNGFFSVVATSVAALVALSFGYSWVLCVGAGAYGLAILTTGAWLRSD